MGRSNLNIKGYKERINRGLDQSSTQRWQQKFQRLMEEE